MGKIKKILENELVEGAQSTDIYPVTSTKAVYDENNERLDKILEASQAKLSELEQKTNRLSQKMIGGNESLSVEDWQHATIQKSLTIQASENYILSPPIFIAKGDFM